MMKTLACAALLLAMLMTFAVQHAGASSMTTITTIAANPRLPPAEPACPNSAAPPPVPVSSDRATNFVTRADYPPVSVRLNEQGTVVVKALVLKDGTVGEVRLGKSSGHERLDEAALRIVKERFRYRPAMKCGEPIDAWVVNVIKYALAGDDEPAAPAQ